MSSSSLASSSEDTCGGGGNQSIFPVSAHSPCTLHLCFFIHPICTVHNRSLSHTQTQTRKLARMYANKTTHNCTASSLCQNVYTASSQQVWFILDNLENSLKNVNVKNFNFSLWLLCFLWLKKPKQTEKIWSDTVTLQSYNTSPFMYRTMLPTEGSGSYWFVNRSIEQQHSRTFKKSIQIACMLYKPCIFFHNAYCTRVGSFFILW